MLSNYHIRAILEHCNHNWNLILNPGDFYPLCLIQNFSAPNGNVQPSAMKKTEKIPKAMETNPQT